MRREDIERSIAGLDEQLRGALLLSTEYTYAESADRLGITTDQLMLRVGEAKRRIVMELLGDWRDPGSRFVIDMHIDAAAMNMQRRRRGVLHRVRQWLEHLVEQTRVQPWRSRLVPVGSFAVIALAVATSMMYLADEDVPDDVVAELESEEIEIEYAMLGPSLGEADGRIDTSARVDTSAGGFIFPASVGSSSSCGGPPPAGTEVERLRWQQACSVEMNSRQNVLEIKHKELEDIASQQIETTWREAETWLDAQGWQLDIQERQLDIQERQLELEEWLQEFQVRRRALEMRRRALEMRRRALEMRRRVAEDRNIDLERERERIEERFRGRQRGSEYRRAFGSYVASWDKEYRQPLDQYSQGMEEYGEEIVRYMCEILQHREELADLARAYETIPPPRAAIPMDSCPDVEMGDGRPVLVRH